MILLLSFTIKKALAQSRHHRHQNIAVSFDLLNNDFNPGA